MKKTENTGKKGTKKISSLEGIEIMNFDEAHNMQGGSKHCGGGDTTIRTSPGK